MLDFKTIEILEPNTEILEIIKYLEKLRDTISELKYYQTVEFVDKIIAKLTSINII